MVLDYAFVVLFTYCLQIIGNKKNSRNKSNFQIVETTIVIELCLAKQKE